MTITHIDSTPTSRLIDPQASFFRAECLREMVGQQVELRPLSLEDVEALAQAGSGDRATYGWTTVPHSIETAEAYVRELLHSCALGEALPFSTWWNGRLVGASRYLNLRWLMERSQPDAVEIGGTWLTASAQRTVANTEAKLLMLGRAFDEWGCGRVDLKTDARNERSRRAIERLGARYEGVLRAWQPSLVAGEEHVLRDTAIFSILPGEWPEIKRTLMARLATP